MGSMIGSGIFIVSADIARQVDSPGLLMIVWLIGAALTIAAALSYGELAAAMPHAGGQYVYLREAFGPLAGFLYGWTLFRSERRGVDDRGGAELRGTGRGHAARGRAVCLSAGGVRTAGGIPVWVDIVQIGTARR